MARLNRDHLGHRGATDVISFGSNRVRRSAPVIGDIYICPEVARRNAAERGASAREEVSRLVVHGVLHVLGYDHPGRDGSRDIPHVASARATRARLVPAKPTARASSS